MTTILEKKTLLTVYKEVYGTEFIPCGHGEKLKMHKAIYLLQESGIVCGDFNFFWHINGPYSHELHKSLLEIESTCSKQEILDYSTGCEFNEKAENAIRNLKSLFSKAGDYGYNSTDWCEALGSIHFIKKYKCSCESDEQVIMALEKEKKNLVNHESNIQALQLLRENSLL